MENKHLIMLAALVAITAIVVAGVGIYLNENPCQEYKTICFYGTRNTHTIDCNDSIESVPEGYSIHRERSCIKR